MATGTQCGVLHEVGLFIVHDTVADRGTKKEDRTWAACPQIVAQALQMPGGHLVVITTIPR